MISQKKIYQLNDLLLILIASTILFSSISTIFMALFIILNIINLRNVIINKKVVLGAIFLMIPFLLELLFFWNNTPMVLGFKALEKVISFLVFPLFISINYKKIDFYKIADLYRYIFSIILIGVIVRFCILKPDFVIKYFNGIHLWEMGYVIANSFNNHAPAVNMHVAFLILVNIYFLFFGKKNKIFTFILLIISVIILFIFNTRVSLGISILGSLIIFSVYGYNKFKNNFVYYFTGFIAIITLIITIAFISNPYMKEKYSKVTFSNMDKIGRLDEVENPDAVLHNALVTRVTMWKSSIDLSKERFFTGFGSRNNKQALLDYYERTDQKFLLKYKFPVHNQFLDYLLKFGILGFLALIYFFYKNFQIAIISKNVLFFVFIGNFLLSNLVDDFLIRFDGIVFCAFWCSLAYAEFQNRKRVF